LVTEWAESNEELESIFQHWQVFASHQLIATSKRDNLSRLHNEHRQ